MPSRFPRVVPSGGLTISANPGRSIFLPEGTSISLNTELLHHDPRIFAHPDEFLPERWMGQKGRELDRWMLAFNKGDRACIGIKYFLPSSCCSGEMMLTRKQKKSLACAELQLVVGNLFSRFELELFETTEEDMKMVDHFVGHIVGRINVKAKKRVMDEHMV